MRRCFTALLVLVVSLLALPGEALANGVGVRYEFSIPFWPDTKPVPHRSLPTLRST